MTNSTMNGFRPLGRLARFGLLASFVCGVLLAQPAQVQAEDMKEDVVERVTNATLLVFTAISQKSKGDRPLGSGSGFFINSTGLLITNNHVVDPTHQKSEQEKFNFHYKMGTLTWTVVVDSGTEDEKTYEAKMIYQNEWADQAILQAVDEDGEKLETPYYLRLIPESRLKERLRLYAMGFPGGDRERTVKDKHPEVTITNGFILDEGLPRTPAGRLRMIYTDVNVRPGNSGGPSVNLDGLVVGTNTLMTKPEFRDDAGGANYTALVPARISGEMVRNAFILGKFPDGSDVTPFMAYLAQEDGTVNIPEFKRLKSRDILYFEDGDRDHGTVEDETIEWECPLGTIEIPTNIIAYIMTNDEGSHLFIEGGNRIGSEDEAASFEFTSLDGEKKTMEFDEIKTLAFRTSDRKIKPLKGKVITFDSDLTTLHLRDVEGKVRFEGKTSIEVALEDLERIESNEDDEQVLILRDGRRLTGEFGEGTYKAVIAATDTPIEFSLREVRRAFVETVWHNDDDVDGLDLRGVLASSGKQVKSLLRKMEEENDPSSVREKTVSLVADKKAFRERTDEQQERIRLLQAVATMRDGKFQEAKKLLRKAQKAKDTNIAAYAAACSNVLKRYPDFQYEGKPLSELTAFRGAGTRIAHGVLADVRDFIRDAQRLEGEHRGEYYDCINTTKKKEMAINAAGIFLGEEADFELIRMWRVAVSACEREWERLQEEERELRESLQGKRGGGQRMAREMEKLNEKREQLVEEWRTYFFKVRGYGFRIEDPDMQTRREKLADSRQWDEQPEEEEDQEKED